MFLSTTIKVPISTLKETSTKLKGYANDNSDIFDRLTNLLAAMEGSGEWKGESMTAALQATRQNKTKFREAVNDLNSLSSFLSKFVSQMSSKDTEIANQIKKA